MLVFFAMSDLPDVALPRQDRDNRNGRSDCSLLPAVSHQAFDDPGNKQNNTRGAQEVGRTSESAGADTVHGIALLAIA